MRLLQRVHCLLVCRLVVGLTLPQYVDGWLARYRGWVGGLQGQGVVWATVALVSAPAFSAGVRGRLVGNLLGHLWVRGRCGHWTVALEVPRGLAVMAGRGFGARIRVRGPCGDVVATVGTSVIADPVALLAWLIRGSDPSAVRGGCPSSDVVDAHWLTG